MGTCYYGCCDDCRQFVDLDKFYGWAGGVRAYADIDKEKLEEYGPGWVYRALRLHFFISQHNGHRLAVRTEHEFERDDWEEVCHWPIPGDGAVDKIDFTDPKASRLIIETRFGTIYLDVRNDGVNFFTHACGERIDSLILPAN